MLTFGGWYYYPSLKKRVRHYYLSHFKKPIGSTSSDIVSYDYRFGDVNSTHLSSARKNGIKPVSHRNKLQTESLTKIKSCDKYLVRHLTHSVPYLTTSSAQLLDDIGTRFQHALKEQGGNKHRIIVTSVLRTEEDVKRLRKVNGNASNNSAHQYATTFDISYISFDRQSLEGKHASDKQLANVLGKVLKQLRDEGRCHIKYEKKQHCFHITSRK